MTESKKEKSIGTVSIVKSNPPNNGQMIILIKIIAIIFSFHSAAYENKLNLVSSTTY